MTSAVAPAASRVRVPATVWALGVVSLFTDISSEIISTLLPIYLVVGMGVSTTALGLLEGFSVAVATVVKFAAGSLSDRVSRPKWLAVAGYGLAALSKPIFPLSAAVEGVAAAKALDRIGKGIRAAPRDAIVVAVTPRPILGRAFGLRKSLDTVGGFVGPLLAIGLMILLSDDVRAVFWVASIPALLSVVVLIFFVKAPPKPQGKSREPPKLSQAVRLSPGTWIVIAVATLIGGARFSEAFLVLKSVDVGVPLALAPVAIIVLHIVFGLAAYPVGILSDRTGRKGLLALSLVFLAVADIALALSQSKLLFFTGVVMWGLHMGFSQGLLTALVAEAAPEQLRGTAFGVFSLATGLIAVVGNGLAGLLWETQGSAATFWLGATVSLLCAAVVYVWSRRGSGFNAD